MKWQIKIVVGHGSVFKNSFPATSAGEKKGLFVQQVIMTFAFHCCVTSSGCSNDEGRSAVMCTE